MFRPIALACAAALSLPLAAETLGTAFTYQGHLVDSGQPASGLYDFEFCRFDVLSGGSGDCLPATSTADVPVENGVFTTQLDFGAIFNGEKRFLELRVRLGASDGPFETLSPRQLIAPTPEALRALTVADGSIAAAQIDAAQVQRRIADSCTAGTFISKVNADGSLTCGASGGSVTSITAGTGLSGGTITTAGTIAIDSSQVQVRVSGTCIAGQVITAIAADGSVACSAASASPLPGVLELDSAVEVDEVSIAVGPDGLPAISYFDADEGDLEFVKCSNASCTGPVTRRTLDSIGLVGSQSSIAVRNDNVPVISYRDVGANQVKIIACTQADCSGTTAKNVLDSSTGAGGTSVALTSTGIPVIAYGQANGLRMARCPNQLCIGAIVHSTLDSLIGPNRQPSLALDSNGFASITYNDTVGNNLKFVHCSTAACQPGEFTATVIDNVFVAGGSSLAITKVLGSVNVPAMSYRKTSGELMFAHCGVADCLSAVERTIVDTVPVAPIVTTSLAIGTGGNAVIGYTNGFLGDLKVAKCANDTCTGGNSISIVRDTAFADSFVDMAVGTDGLPVLVYKGLNKLRFAKCSTSSCQ